MKHLAVGLLFLVSMQMLSASGFTKQKFEYFTLSVPTGVVVKKTSPVEDFEIYTLEKNGQAYLNIYLGNHPSFPKSSAVAQEVITKLNSGNVEIISFWRGKQLSRMELLLKLADKGWPRYMHAWINDGLNSDDLAIAQAMLMSIDTRESENRGQGRKAQCVGCQ